MSEEKVGLSVRDVLFISAQLQQLEEDDGIRYLVLDTRCSGRRVCPDEPHGPGETLEAQRRLPPVASRSTATQGRGRLYVLVSRSS
jgi:hypothetical protein